MNIYSLGTKNTGQANNYKSQKNQSEGEFAVIMERSKEEQAEKNTVSELSKREDVGIESTVIKSTKVDTKIGADNVSSFSGTYQERIEQLKKLNAETDWESMSDVEKVKTFQDRYEKAFGGKEFFLTASLYSNYSERHREIYDSYISEKQKYFAPGGLHKLNSQYSDVYREVYYGKMNDDEVRAAIKKKFEGTGSMEDKFAVLHELSRSGVDSFAEDEMRHHIRHEIHLKAWKALEPLMYGTGKRIDEHPRFSEYYMTYAKGVGEGAEFRPSWEQLAQSLIEDAEMASRQSGENVMSPEELEELKNLMDQFLADMEK